MDPELPDVPEKSPVRISFSYLMDYMRNDRTSAANWAAIQTDPRIGMLTDGWHGTVSETNEPFTARLHGPVLRINMNGSFFRVPERNADGAMGNADSLFFKR
jgi:hypothetical protein